MTDTATSATLKTYPFPVDYGMSLAAMVAAGEYNEVDPNIDADNFPHLGTGIVNLEGVLYHPDRLISSEDCISEMEQEEQPIWSATMAELLAFGAKFPHIQQLFPVVALGQKSKRLRDGNHGVGCLSGSDAKRYLKRLVFEEGWFASCQFLGFRKATTLTNE